MFYRDEHLQIREHAGRFAGEVWVGWVSLRNPTFFAGFCYGTLQ
jgi:hypothetical protein